MIPNKSARELLSTAVAAATPSCAGMFTHVRQDAAQTRNGETKPIEPGASATRSVGPAREAGPGTGRADATSSSRAGMCGDVQEGAAKTGNDETNPSSTASLTARQIAAARLLALGRHGRAVAAEVGVNEHTITRWRRSLGFADEVRRQHDLILAAVADRVARKYGLAPGRRA